MRIALTDEMRTIDRAASERYGLTEPVLMENAGHAVLSATCELLGSDLSGKKVCVLAGSGNNGGDAFVAARFLHNRGAKVRVFFLGDRAHQSPSAARNREVCEKFGLAVQELAAERDWDKLQLWLHLANVVIDGVLGTGVSGILRESHRRLFTLVNAVNVPVVAIDIASGVDGNTGRAEAAIRADITITFGLPKVGHFFAPGSAFTGKLIVDDISLPPALLSGESIKQIYLDESAAKALLPKRAIDAHKGTCGRILLFAGSLGMTGAACLASEAVLRVGAGTATVATANPVVVVLGMKLTEVMTRVLPEIRTGVIGSSAVDEARALMPRYDAVLMGPGLGRDESTLRFVREVAAAAKTPLVMDADALTAWQGHTDELAALTATTILTPHLGEMAALLDISVDELRRDLVPRCRQAAKDWNAIVVAKSECTIVVYPDGRVYFTSKGNACMATAGSGDVLAGTIAGLLGQVAAEDAPLLGVYLHGLAGDLAADAFAEGLLAGDILRQLPSALIQLKSCAS